MRLAFFIALGSSLGLSVLTGAHVHAEQPSLDATPAPADTGPKLTLSGFIDSSITAPLTDIEGDPDKGVRLGLDQVELDVEVRVSPALRLRVDLEYFPAEDTTGAAAVFDAIVEQAFAETTICETGLFVRAGKWNAPVGFEVIDPTGLWQYSYGLLFSLATPANLTGVAFGWANDTTSTQLWLSNGWDQPSTVKAASVGGRVQHALGDAGTIGLSATYGALAEEQPKLMLDMDVALAFGALSIGAELNYGSQGSARSYGALLALKYGFSDAFSLTLRGDYLDRELLDSAYKGMALTLAGLVTFMRGLDLVVEVRADLPDGLDTAVVGALELIASF